MEDLMPVIPSGKYQLRSLHEEIDLFDRKLAHLKNHETFASEEARSESIDKMTAKRNLLVRKAQQMIEEGIEFKDSELPRSLRPEEISEAPEAPAAAPVEAEAAPALETAPRAMPSPYRGTVLDYAQDLENYRKNKNKRKSA
jgi:hypothetical protein